MSLSEFPLALNRPMRQSEPTPVVEQAAAEPQQALRAYTNAVMVTGVLLVAGFAAETLRTDPFSLAGLFALAIITSFFKLDLRLSSSSATMTLGYAAGFIGLITLGPHPTAIAVSAGIWTQCAYRSGLSTPMDLRRRLFSVACGVITVEAAGWSFAATGGYAERLSIGFARGAADGSGRDLLLREHRPGGRRGGALHRPEDRGGLVQELSVERAELLHLRRHRRGRNRGRPIAAPIWSRCSSSRRCC